MTTSADPTPLPMTEAEIAEASARWAPQPRHRVHVAMDRHRESPPFCWRVGGNVAMSDGGACEECGWKEPTVPSVELDVVRLLATISALSAERDDAKARANEMHRRAQLAESIAQPIIDGRPQSGAGRSMGRALANLAATQERERAVFAEESARMGWGSAKSLAIMFNSPATERAAIEALAALDALDERIPEMSREIGRLSIQLDEARTAIALRQTEIESLRHAALVARQVPDDIGHALRRLVGFDLARRKAPKSADIKAVKGAEQEALVALRRQSDRDFNAALAAVHQMARAWVHETTQRERVPAPAAAPSTGGGEGSDVLAEFERIGKSLHAKGIRIRASDWLRELEGEDEEPSVEVVVCDVLGGIVLDTEDDTVSFAAALRAAGIDRGDKVRITRVSKAPEETGR